MKEGINSNQEVIALKIWNLVKLGRDHIIGIIRSQDIKELWAHRSIDPKLEKK